MQTPAVAAVGDKIEHEFVPGFVMTVEATKPCELGAAQVEHQQYQITDPDEITDWLCAYDVRKVG